MLEKSAVEDDRVRGQVGLAQSQLLREDDLDFESPFTNRGIFTQQRQDSESDLSVVFD